MSIAIAQCSDLKNYTDCNGVVLPNNTALVTCASLPTQLCAALAGLTAAGTAVVGVTKLVGADCSTYVLPSATPTTNALSLTGSNLTSTVNGVPSTVDLAPAVCATFAAKAAATTPATATTGAAGTIFLGAD